MSRNRVRGNDMSETRNGMDRRKFVKAAALGAGAVLSGADPASAAPESRRQRGAPAVHTRQTPDIAVIGAGTFGAWTALSLQQSGAQVTLIDQYGPANSRATSGGETRGVRTGYGNRGHGLLWTGWAKRAIEKWNEWDERWQDMPLPRVFFTT